MMWLACAILLVLPSSSPRAAAAQAVPRGLRNLLEMLIVFLRDEVARKAIPHGAERFLGYLLTTFFFILSCNLLGLIPGAGDRHGQHLGHRDTGDRWRSS